MSRFITQEPQIIKAVESYRSAASVLTLAKEQQDEDKKHIIAYMSNEGVETMQAGSNLVKLTRYTSVRFDSIKFRQENPEMAAKYTQEVEAIRFTVKDA